MIAACTAGRATSEPPILEYVRANPDGSERETILVRRPTPSRVEVVKLRDRCTRAGYVTADVDRMRRSAVRLSAGRLLPQARRAAFGELSHDASAQALTVTITVDGVTRTERLRMPAGPWHLYDFDLASLSAVWESAPADTAPVRFRLPLVWNGDAPLLRDLGEVTLTYEREEMINGRKAYRYSATGASPRFVGGPLWRDAADGHVIAARWGTPNHAEYTAFDLRLVARHAGGGRWWRRRLGDHFRGCG